MIMLCFLVSLTFIWVLNSACVLSGTTLEIYTKNYCEKGKIANESLDFIFNFNKFGEGYTFKKDFNYEEFLNSENAKVKKVETVNEGMFIYAYSNKIKYFKYIDGEKINIEIFVAKDYVKIGFPLILSSC